MKQSENTKGELILYKADNGNTEVEVRLKEDTVWLNQKQMSILFDKDTDTVGLHIKNIFKEKELNKKSTTEYYSVVQKEGKRVVNRKILHYNLDVIISVGYRVKSQRGTQFRIWANKILKEYLVKGYSINEKRLAQKELEVQYLKTGIRILNRALEEKALSEENQVLKMFAKGLELLDDYDHETLDIKGKTKRKVKYPTYEEYISLINNMYSEFKSDVFAKEINESFKSSINQIKQTFGGKELYPSIEEKAANLLYFITKNHSFADGNKRIAAACFLYFLQKNKALFNKNKEQILSNDALASLTLFIASSKSEESEIVKKLILSVLNRNIN